MTQLRVRDFDAGRAMVVTDLHGAGPVYRHLRDTFLALHEAGDVDRLIICGDLIHNSEPRRPDESLDMILDLMRLQKQYGPDTIVMLLGNHEMPHIYSVSLSKGEMLYTPPFEEALAALDRDTATPETRADVMAFLMDLPIYVRTKAGVLISHAGASEALDSVEVAEIALDFDHAAILKLADDKLAAKFDVKTLAQRADYVSQARFMLAIEGPEDSRLTHWLRGQLISQTVPEFNLLWDLLFTRNEMGSNLRRYSEVIKQFLSMISAVSPYEQRVVIAGHIGVEDGAGCIGMQQLRMASYTHAMPTHEGRYLVLDCAAPVQIAQELEPHLHRVFVD